MKIQKLKIGERIKESRLSLNLNREAFAELLNISPNFLGQLERGEKLFRIATLYNLVETTHLSADYFLFEYSKSDYIHNLKKQINYILDFSSEETLECYYNVLLSISKYIKGGQNE